MVIRWIFYSFFFGSPQLLLAKELFEIQGGLLESAPYVSYDQAHRFIWTCYKAPSQATILKRRSIVLDRERLCLCEPGGSIQGIGLHVSHIQGISPSSTGSHRAYRAIELENKECQSFAAYTP